MSNKASQVILLRGLILRQRVTASAFARSPATTNLWQPSLKVNSPDNALQPTRQRFFHSSSRLELPIRRRRRPSTQKTTDDDSGEEPSTNPLKHIPIDDDVEFVQAASALFDKLQQALEPMKEKNDFFEVERFFGDMGEVLTIDLGPKEGKYRIEMSIEDHLFEYSSPISGKVLYVLSAQTGEWVGSEDGHLFEGLLVRDLIRQCRGLPKL